LKIVCITESEKIEVSDSGNTILQSLEAQGIDAQYHCRDGFCGACRCKIKSGSVEYTVDPLAYIEDDEILPCCSVPLTDIEIDLNR